MRIPVVLALCVLAAGGAARAQGQRDFPLQDLAVRDAVNLSGTWQFREDPAEQGAREGWYTAQHDRSSWRPASVPGVWGQKPGAVGIPVSSGLGWYARKTAVPAAWTGDIALVFLGSQLITDVWVNGVYAGVHRGGYTPFILDVTKAAVRGKTAEVVVRVDNRPAPDSVPSSHIGWQMFGGLTREVYLIHRPKIRLERIATLATVPGEGEPTLSVKAVLVNGSARTWRGAVTARLLDGTAVAAGAEVSATADPGGLVPLSLLLKPKAPRLWSPENPFLYTLALAWRYAGENSVEFPVGIRQFQVKDGRILLNNRPVWLQGFGNHEEYAGHGPCLTEPMRLGELALMKDEFNANCFRPGHYPNHPVTYTLCDRLGIITHPELPSWQIGARVSDSDQAWERWQRPQLREMVETLRNHASVAFWGLSNEQYNTDVYHRRGADYVRSLDSSRFVTIVNASDADLAASRFTDIAARNFHYGWYHSRSVYALRDYLPKVLAGTTGQPVWVAELGAHATLGNLGGGYGDQSRHSETYQDHVVRYGFQYCATESERIAGVSVWTLADFHRGNSLEQHGILTEKREPKLLASTICNLMRGDLRLFLCEENALVQPGTAWRTSARYFNPRERECKGMKVRWRILKGDRPLKDGEFSFDVPASRAGEVGVISWDAPADAAGLYTCWVELLDSSGAWVYTNSSPFDVKATSRPGILHVRALNSGNALSPAYMLFAGVRIPIHPFTGLMFPLPAGTYQLAVVAPGVGSVDREVTVVDGQKKELFVDFAR